MDDWKVDNHIVINPSHEELLTQMKRNYQMGAKYLKVNHANNIVIEVSIAVATNYSSTCLRNLIRLKVLCLDLVK